jgi:hypothetical protein
MRPLPRNRSPLRKPRDIQPAACVPPVQPHPCGNLSMIHGMSSMGYFLRIRRHIAAQRPGLIRVHLRRRRLNPRHAHLRRSRLRTLRPFAPCPSLPVLLPTGSKVRLVREVHMVCSPYGGCDACMLLPAKVEIPAMHTAAMHTPALHSVGRREIKVLNVRRQPWMRGRVSGSGKHVLAQNRPSRNRALNVLFSCNARRYIDEWLCTCQLMEVEPCPLST